MSTNWVHLSQTAGTGNQSVTVTADVNASAISRTCKIKVSCGDITKYVYISQDAAPLRIISIYFAGASTIYLPYSGGTATKEMSTYMVKGVLNDGSEMQIGNGYLTFSGAPVTISTVSTAATPTEVGSLPVYAIYSGASATTTLTATTNVPIYELAAPQNTPITYSASTKQNINLNRFTPSASEHVFENGVGTIYFSSAVTEIKTYAFVDCTGMTSVVLPNSVTAFTNTSAQGGPFDGCTKLKSITLSNNIVDLGYNAFHGLDKLESIVIPNSVSLLREHTFYGCTSLSAITYQGTKAQWLNLNKEENWIGYTWPSAEYVICTDGTIPLQNYIEIYDTSIPIVNSTAQTGIHLYQFDPIASRWVKANNRTTLTFNYPLKKVGKRAFYGVQSDAYAILPSTEYNGQGYIELEEEAFGNGTIMPNTFSNSAKCGLDSYCFLNNTGLKEFQLYQPYYIENDVFSGCTNFVILYLHCCTRNNWYQLINSSPYWNRGTNIEFVSYSSGNTTPFGTNGLDYLGPSLSGTIKYCYYGSYWWDNKDFGKFTPNVTKENQDTRYNKLRTLVSSAGPITEINDYAFNESNFTGIALPSSITYIGNYIFNNNLGPFYLCYEGTMSDWNNITKAANWTSGSRLIGITCSDGVITL